MAMTIGEPLASDRRVVLTRTSMCRWFAAVLDLQRRTCWELSRSLRTPDRLSRVVGLALPRPPQRVGVEGNFNHGGGQARHLAASGAGGGRG